MRLAMFVPDAIEAIQNVSVAGIACVQEEHI